MKRFVLLVVSFLMATMLFADPFGLKMGMTLNEIKAKCGGKEPEYEGHGISYKIEPIKKDKTFVKHSVGVSNNLGLFLIAVMTDIKSKEKCEFDFNSVFLLLKSYYGEPSKVEGLSCEWHADKCEKLKKEKLSEISIDRIYDNYGKGVVALFYKFENFEKAMESRDSPF